MNRIRIAGIALIFLMIGACAGSGGTSSSPTYTPTPISTSRPISIPTFTPTPSQTPIISGGFPGSILLGNVTDNSITISIISERDSEISLKYGLSSNMYSLNTDTHASEAGMPLEITLSNLSPNSKYYYRVIYSEPGESGVSENSESSFSTQKLISEDFNFAIHADAHVGIRVRGPDEEEKADDDQYSKTLYNTLAFSPDFLIDLGDTFMSEKNAQRDFYDMTDVLDPTPPTQTWIEEDYIFLRSFFNLIGHSLPLYLVNGNHEGESGWEKHEEHSVAVWANNLRKDLFPVVSANDFYSASNIVEPYVGTHDGYYSWTWGAALFVVLDPFWYASTKPKVDNEWAWTLGKEQYDWLISILENNDSQYKFVFIHNLVGGLNGSDAVGSGRGGALVADHWEWGGINPNTEQYEFDMQRPGWGRPIHDILVDNHVDVVFHGHDHVFVREDHRDGIIYQAVPQPSILNDNDSRALKRAEDAGYDVVDGIVHSGSGFLNVSVSQNEANITFLRTLEDVSLESCALGEQCYEEVYSYDIPKMTLTSPVFKDTGSGHTILPLSYTCEGKDGGTSPWLTWSGVPEGTRSLALLMNKSGDGITNEPTFTLFNISPEITTLPPGDFSIGIAAEGDMSNLEIENAGGIPFNTPCASGAGNTYEYHIELYALSKNLELDVSATQAQVRDQLAEYALSSEQLVTQRVHWDADSIEQDLHVPSSVRSSCEEKIADFMEYSRVHAAITCNESANQMDIVSHISDGLKTSLSDQQIQVGITRWIGRLSFPSQSGSEIRIEPTFLDGVNNNISCDGTGKLGISVDGQIILPYYKQTTDAGGNTCGPTDGADYANRDTVVLGEVDQCYGHSPNGEGYHLHGAPICLMDVHDPSKPVAYMSDGIPMYFGQAGGTIENTLHAQSADTVTDANFGAGLYEHLDFRPSDVKDGSNPLNECNAYDINGDGPISGYVYYSTKEAPYSIGCFMGEVLSSPQQVQVTRTNFNSSRSGWTGQTVGQGIDVTIVGNYFGMFENKIYNITEMLVTQSNSFLNEGDYAQVLWRVIEAGEAGYNEAATCFELRYRANKEITSNDETEISCSRNLVPSETLSFTPFSLNQAQSQSSSVDYHEEITFELEAWADK